MQQHYVEHRSVSAALRVGAALRVHTKWDWTRKIFKTFDLNPTQHVRSRWVPSGSGRGSTDGHLRVHLQCCVSNAPAELSARLKTALESEQQLRSHTVWGLDYQWLFQSPVRLTVSHLCGTLVSEGGKKMVRTQHVFLPATTRFSISLFETDFYREHYA